MKNVLTIALETPSLSTLVKLLKAAGLVETIQNLQDATVFAPTNEAFEDFPSDMLEELLLPGNHYELRKILLTHVVGQKLLSSSISDGLEVKSASGAPLEFHLQMGKVFVMSPMSTAKVTRADIRADNEVVIHLISQVLS